MNITIPELCLVVLVGPSGCGKSTFARKHFKSTEILSSDFFRGLVGDDENNQAASKDAFEVLHLVLGKRLTAGYLTVVDATNVQADARKELLRAARAHHVAATAIVFNLTESLCHERDRLRKDRTVGGHVIHVHCQSLRQSLGKLQSEGFRDIHILSTPEEVERVQIVRRRLPVNLRQEGGPFDIIGDVHGCFDELEELLTRLGYTIRKKPSTIEGAGDYELETVAPPGRKAVFVGDLVDRGPNVPDVLRLVMRMVQDGSALCVAGNHDDKLTRALKGNKVNVTHGLRESLDQLARESSDFRDRVLRFLDSLVSHYVLDQGRLVIAHAGLKEHLQGRTSGTVRAFALYGATTGETDEDGLPVRLNWAGDYGGKAMVVYGHTPVQEPEWLNKTINIDTGCVFGGKLTALRYPERELVSVPSRRTYCEHGRPFLVPSPVPPTLATSDEMLDWADFQGRRVIDTRLMKNISIREESMRVALEVTGRLTVDPRQLIYLPPVMSPCDAARGLDLLEHPSDAFAYYRREGTERVVVEEKHAGSRAMLIVGRSADTVRRRFGIANAVGSCYTRMGLRCFDDRNLEACFLDRIRRQLDSVGFWEQFHTDWVCLDCVIVPRSSETRGAFRSYFGGIGTAAGISLSSAVELLEKARFTDQPSRELLDRFRTRQQVVEAFADVCRQTWSKGDGTEPRAAPFHLLATEGTVHIHKDHAWHMKTLTEMCRSESADCVLIPIAHRTIRLNDEAACNTTIRWWEELTARGSEGIVVKPLDFVSQARRGLAQPALKCRGRDVLRLVYGPEYTLPEHLERLRDRRLGPQRSLALRQFTLGIDALERFVRGEPLRAVHECCLGIIALQSEPVDPRL